MNKEKFYEWACEKMVEEILKISDNKELLYNFLLNDLSYLKDEDCDDIENEILTMIHMSLTNALSICNDLHVNKVSVLLKDTGLILFKGNPCDLMDMITFNFRESIECSLYNGGHTILVHHIDKDILGDSK